MGKTKLSPLRARLQEHTDCRRLRSFRSTAEGVLHQGDIPGLMAWLTARRQQGLCRGCEVPEAAALTEAALVTAQRQKERLLKLRDRQAEAHRAGAAERQAQLRQVLAEREAQRRASDSHAHVRAVVKNPAPRRQPVVLAAAAAEPILAAAVVPTASPQARGRHYGARPANGECGVRIAAQIDAVLADIWAWDLVEPPPLEEFDWEGLEALIAEVQAEAAAPAGLDALLVEIQSEDAAPAEAAVEPEAPPEPPTAMAVPESEPEALQQEPPMPVVLPAPEPTADPSGREPERSEPPRASSVWEQLDLSPRARALGALVAALQAAPAEGQVCLPSEQAAALLEALL